MTKVLNKRPIAHDPHCYVFQDGPARGSAPRRCCHRVARPAQVRHSGSWAWFVWLRWYSNQGNGPAHPLQRQLWSRSPEMRGPPRLRRGGGAGRITPLQGTPAELAGGSGRGLSDHHHPPGKTC